MAILEILKGIYVVGAAIHGNRKTQKENKEMAQKLVTRIRWFAQPIHDLLENSSDSRKYALGLEPLSKVLQRCAAFLLEINNEGAVGHTVNATDHKESFKNLNTELTSTASDIYIFLAGKSIKYTKRAEECLQKIAQTLVSSSSVVQPRQITYLQNKASSTTNWSDSSLKDWDELNELNISSLEARAQTARAELAQLSMQLGDAYEKKEDYDTAELHYKQAASLGLPEAKYRLGNLYTFPDHEDLEQAIHWLNEAAKKEHIGAENALVHYCDKIQKSIREKRQQRGGQSYLANSSLSGSSSSSSKEEKDFFQEEPHSVPNSYTPQRDGAHLSALSLNSTTSPDGSATKNKKSPSSP